MPEWKDVEPVIRERLWRHLDEGNTEWLLQMRDGGPVGLDADVYLARLIGFEDEIVADLRLDRARPEWLLAIPERVAVAQSEPVDYSPMRTARYVLQSPWATMKVESLLFGLPPSRRPDHLSIVALLLYRRRV